MFKISLEGFLIYLFLYFLKLVLSGVCLCVCLCVFCHDHRKKAAEHGRSHFPTIQKRLSLLYKFFCYCCVNECGTPECVFEFHVPEECRQE